MASRKIACLGGGSLYFPAVVNDLALNPDLAGSEVVLYDIDAAKVECMARYCRGVAERRETGMRVRATTRVADAVDGADFAVSSIGGSGASISRNVYGSYHHTADLHIQARYGVQQAIGDTCGPAGLMMGLRSIPPLIAICREMEKRCPRAILLNHSNPMAVIMRALHKYTPVTAIGVCHGVQGGIAAAARFLGLPARELECIWIGTNHYYWFTRMLHRGRDVLPRLMRLTRERRPDPRHAMAAELSAIYGHRIVYPDDAHILEFYGFAAQYPRQDDLPYGLRAAAHEHGFDARRGMPRRRPVSRTERQAFMRNYAKVLADMRLPDVAGDSLTGEGVGAAIAAMAAGRRYVWIANMANRGAIPNLPATAEVEIEAVTDSMGVRGVSMGEAPLVLKGMLEKRFVWQELAADAAVTGDRAKALQALMIDETAVIPSRAAAMLDELLEASRDLLPHFFSGRRGRASGGLHSRGERRPSS